MALILDIHSQNPQERLIKKVVESINSGLVVAYPTDSGYALGCSLDNKDAQKRIINIRKLSKNHWFTFMVRDLKDVSKYGKIDNNVFRLLKKILPGPYTFVLEATKAVPKRLLDLKRKTIGFRVVDDYIIQSILASLQQPLLNSSLILPDKEFYNTEDVNNAIGNNVDIIISSQYCPPNPTTVVDFSKDDFKILREGAGNLDWLD